MFNIIKGWLGEKSLTLGMWVFLNENIYRRIDNIIVPASDGTTQIDHVLVSVYGIFVVETKNLQGWIFGSPDQREWTQVIYGKKYQFQNPLRQNYRHTKCLSEYLRLDHGIFRSVVMFMSECTFKTQMPDNVLNSGFRAYLGKFTHLCLTPEQVADVERTLRSLKDRNAISKAEHLHSLEVRHESDTGCPKCGSKLVERTAKRGANSGRRFIGCSNYPRCKYTRAI
jgi:hypothetical protein